MVPNRAKPLIYSGAIALSLRQSDSQKVSVFGVFLVFIQWNTDQKYSDYGHFSRSAAGVRNP